MHLLTAIAVVTLPVFAVGHYSSPVWCIALPLPAVPLRGPRLSVAHPGLLAVLRTSVLVLSRGLGCRDAEFGCSSVCRDCASLDVQQPNAITLRRPVDTYCSSIYYGSGVYAVTVAVLLGIVFADSGPGHFATPAWLAPVSDLKGSAVSACGLSVLSFRSGEQGPPHWHSDSSYLYLVLAPALLRSFAAVLLDGILRYSAGHCGSELGGLHGTWRSTAAVLLWDSMDSGSVAIRWRIAAWYCFHGSASVSTATSSMDAIASLGDLAPYRAYPVPSMALRARAGTFGLVAAQHTTGSIPLAVLAGDH